MPALLGWLCCVVCERRVIRVLFLAPVSVNPVMGNTIIKECRICYSYCYESFGNTVFWLADMLWWNFFFYICFKKIMEDAFPKLLGYNCLQTLGNLNFCYAALQLFY